MPLESSLSRSLTVLADGTEVPVSGRLRLTGRETLSLLPAFFRLECRNLSEEHFLTLTRAKEISILFKTTWILTAAPRESLRTPLPEGGTLTTLILVKNAALWDAAVSLSVPAGTAPKETVLRILSESGTDIPLLNDPFPSDAAFTRGWSFHDRAARCIQSVLSPFSLRPSLVPSGLRLIPSSGLPVSLTLTEKDLIDAPVFIGMSSSVSPSSPSKMILSTPPTAFLPGETAVVSYGETAVTAILTERFLRLDTGSGPWSVDMLAEVLPNV